MVAEKKNAEKLLVVKGENSRTLFIRHKFEINSMLLHFYRSVGQTIVMSKLHPQQ
jgi:hypothetical protein